MMPVTRRHDMTQLSQGVEWSGVEWDHEKGHNSFLVHTRYMAMGQNQGTDRLKNMNRMDDLMPGAMTCVDPLS